MQVLDGGTHILLKLNVVGGHLLRQLLQGRLRTAILHRLCKCMCRLLELLLFEWRSLVFAGGGLKLLFKMARTEWKKLCLPVAMERLWVF